MKVTVKSKLICCLGGERREKVRLSVVDCTFEDPGALELTGLTRCILAPETKDVIKIPRSVCSDEEMSRVRWSNRRISREAEKPFQAE